MVPELLSADIPMVGKKKSVLFVCLGNICRSPIAEAVFLDLLKERGQLDEWEVDSAAIIGFHSGNPPERRARQTLEKFGIKDYEHRARVLTIDDGRKFDYIFGMDDQNYKDIKEEIGNNATATVDYLGSYDPKGIKIVPDPYYTQGVALFEQVYEQCRRCCAAFLDTQK